MKSITKRPGNVARQRRATIPAEESYYQIPVAKIAFSPRNYRRFYDQQALEELAGQLAVGELIAPIIVRPGKRGNYELVVGERRLRAAQMAGLKTLPARIRELTDEQVDEIQLIENMQRENPHPLDEALKIAKLQESGRTIEEVARVLGKTVAYIYNRRKLAELIEPLQEVYFNGKLTINEAIELGSLPQDAQTDFFERQCTGWKEQKNFNIGNVRYLVGRYKFDLKSAPFNTRDKKLVPEAGACGGCPFNSATLKTLFPELAKEAVCSNRTCFKNKCLVSAEQRIRTAIESHAPDGILLGAFVDDESTIVVDSLPETVDLPRIDRSDVKILKEPEAPVKENYTEWVDHKGKEVFAKERYQNAVQEYKEDLADYQRELGADSTRKGLLLARCEVLTVYFNPDARNTTTSSAGQITAKQVQEAIKAGVETPELLTGEIERLKTREARAKELDREKVQMAVHTQFCEGLAGATLMAGLTDADRTAIRFMVYQGLTYQNRHTVEKALFPKGFKDNADFFERLAALTDEQMAYLIRMVISGNGESKTARFMHAYCLYQMAVQTGIHVSEIEEQQQKKASEREAKKKLRTKELQVRIKRLKAKN